METVNLHRFLFIQTSSWGWCLREKSTPWSLAPAIRTHEAIVSAVCDREGRVVEELFSDPGKRIRRDLQNFKAYAEGMEERMTI